MPIFKKPYIIASIVLLLALISWRYFVFRQAQKLAQRPSAKVLGVYTGTGDFASQIIGETNTQAILTYNSPTTSPCTVVVSQSSGLTPLINDVNPVMFTGSNLDSRTGGFSNGVSRIFVIGKRSADIALDGNRYSRALEAYSPYYYQVTCGSSVATGQFSTQTIPNGLTYSDTVPSDSKGSSTWPTIFNQRNQEIIDPQTGLLIKRATIYSDGWPQLSSPHNTYGFGAAGSTDVCSPVLVADNNGIMGYHCTIGGEIFWLDPATGNMRPVGGPASQYDGVQYGGFAFCGMMDLQSPNDFYCVAADINDNPAVTKLTYTGQNTLFSDILPICTGTNAPCTTQTDLTPGANNLPALVTSFDAAYANFHPQYNIYNIRSIANGKLEIEVNLTGQNSLSWEIVFDPGNGIPVGTNGSTAKVAAAMSTYLNYPVRWCGVHYTDPVGEVNWVNVSPQFLYANSNYGYGYFSSHTTDLPAATTSCPTNSFGDTSCTTVTVDGEPCNSDQTSNISTSTACGIPTASYLQDAQPGDLFAVSGGDHNYSEYVRLVQKNGTSWTFSRGLFQSTVADHSAATLDAMCSAKDTSVNSGLFGSYFWDYLDDPHGTGTPGTTIIFDGYAQGTHYAYHPDEAVEGEGQGNGTYVTRSGGIPAFITAPQVELPDLNPPFSGVSGIGIQNTVDSHPTYYYNNQFFIDARPMQGGINYNSSASALGGNIYKYAAGAITVHRKQLATLAYNGTYILNDVSGATSDITAAADHSYCYVENAGECYSGSQPTEVYVKTSTVTSSDCPYPGVGSDGWNLQSICIGDNSMDNQAITQTGNAVLANGKNGRMLTHGLTTYDRQDVFWNARFTPDGTGVLFTLPEDVATYGAGSGGLFYAKLPPTVSDSVLRNDFLSIPVDIASSTNASSATVKFGYVENGQPTDYYCTSRKEACVKGSQSGVNYDFASATVTPVSCVNGCSINVPAIPDRVVYMQVQYYDASGSPLSTLNPQTVVAEPPYNITSADYVPLPTPTPTITATPTPTPTVNQGGGGGGGGGYYVPPVTPTPNSTSTLPILTTPVGLQYQPTSPANPLPFTTGSLVNADGTIYYINQNIKIPFTTLKAFLGLGYSLKNVVKGDLSSYTPAKSFFLSSPTQEHVWGSWLSYGKLVYYSTSDGFIPIPSLKIFTDNGGELKLIVKMSSTELKLLKAHTLSPMGSGDQRVGG